MIPVSIVSIFENLEITSIQCLRFHVDSLKSRIIVDHPKCIYLIVNVASSSSKCITFHFWLWDSCVKLQMDKP